MNSSQNIDIEEWKREFFSARRPLSQEPEEESGSTRVEAAFLEDRISEDIQCMELMSPDAFNRIPMIYEMRESKSIEENWREYRRHLTQDYLKKSKQASRKLKKQNAPP
ncbi:hypothetical protein OJ253_3441 [Cryptosporidium canis]|uniref:Uncharacterized protein n=1 Tax=Cryptosporidium canis TaxID=195482 RepID=A0A9D5DHG1_9CRYT|nr:hypothetical protein OJ253_3441 [Cryptosporidium canis]